jgi:hypothetical protein
MYDRFGTCQLNSMITLVNYPDPDKFPISASIAEEIVKWFVVSRQSTTSGTCNAGYAYQTDDIVSIL